MEGLKGGLAYYGYESASGYEGAKPQYDTQGYRWSATEYNSNNSRNCDFGSGNFNNNNKNWSFMVRPVVAYDVPEGFLDLVIAAFEDCCRNKRTSAECIAYLERAADDLPRLARELYTCTYRPGASTCFLVRYPQYREVFAAGFRDRIVHHFICLLLNPHFEKCFRAQGNVSFNCRKGFGTLAAQRAAYAAIREATGRYRTEAWVYRGDLVSFFMSIDKRVLWRLLEPFIRSEYRGEYLRPLLYAARTVVFHCPQRLCTLSTPPGEWRRHIDEGKSLFACGDNFGMPIGNLTTQVFANFLLSFFDEWAADWLTGHGCQRHYVRFVDDFVAVCPSKSLLKRFARDARVFLQSRLGLTLHRRKHHFQRASHGLRFVGAYAKNGRMYLANRTVARMTERVFGFNRMLERKRTVTLADLMRVEQVVNSYLGFCKGKRTYAIRKRALGQLGHGFYKYFYIGGHYERIRLKRGARLVQAA